MNMEYPYSSSPEPELSFAMDPLIPYDMDIPRSPMPGPSSAMDPISVELEMMMSPQETESYYDISGVDLFGDEELYGILSGNNDNILDEMSSANPDEETINIGDSQANLQDEEEEETIGWFPGNPSNMPNITFTETSGILSPHDEHVQSPLDYFFLFFNAQFMNLILDCTNKYGNRLKAAATTSRARFRQWTDISVAEFKIFLGISVADGNNKTEQNGRLLVYSLSVPLKSTSIHVEGQVLFNFKSLKCSE